ncbi:MAG: hypothetical protein KBH21_00565 [Acetoanaerobium sp.]|nr:hypothetical protein [Acetoanaerobium sp.]
MKLKYSQILPILEAVQERFNKYLLVIAQEEGLDINDLVMEMEITLKNNSVEDIKDDVD